MKASPKEVTDTPTCQGSGTSEDDTRVATIQFPSEIATRAPPTGVTCIPKSKGTVHSKDGSEVRPSLVPLEDTEEAGAEKGDGHPFWAFLYQAGYWPW